MAERDGIAKVCVLCKEDVARKPRHKDARGRYFCEPCFQRAKEHAAKKKSVSAESAAPTQTVEAFA